MNNARRFLSHHVGSFALLLASSFAGGCAVDSTVAQDDPNDGVETSNAGISAFDWSAPSDTGQAAATGGVVAKLNGTTYMVHSGAFVGDVSLWWSKLVGATWTAPIRIPDQTSASRVSIAAFNGRLYMIRNSTTTANSVHLSRFDPATEQWSPGSRLPYTSSSAPALAAFQGRLYMVGVSPAQNQLWMASIDADDNMSSQTMMAGHYSQSAVSLAVYQDKLYMAHRAGATSTIVFNSFDGTAWGADRTIPAGPGGAAITGEMPSIGVAAGYLHLVHTQPAYHQSYVWWTYFNGTSWAPEVTLGENLMTIPPTLGQGGRGVVMLVAYDYSSPNQLKRQLHWSQLRDKRLPTRVPTDVWGAADP
jgi:hypothetical protein